MQKNKRKKIAEFKLAGLTYKVYDDLKAENERWGLNNPLLEVYTKTIDYGQKLSKETIKNNIWDAALYMTISLVMEKRKLYEELGYGYNSALTQGINTMFFDFTKKKGSVSILSTKYPIKINNPVAWQNSFLGRFDPTIEEILICDTCEKTGKPFDTDFMIQTMYHEMIHAVNFKMGYKQHIKSDKESFVNPLSVFIHEIDKSLKMFLDEDNK